MRPLPRMAPPMTTRPLWFTTRQRVLFSAPTERIIVHILLLMEEQSTTTHVAHEVLVGLLDPTAGIVWCFAGEISVWPHRADKFRSVAIHKACLFSDQYVVVNFAERGRLVHDSRATIDGHELCWHNSPSDVLAATLDKLAELFTLAGVLQRAGRRSGA